ncbi:peptidase m35 [Diplodia corticola]|uniref:Peptidase m35 n=1 Tax=Diplodia corticola TaxID=236234 RepID=A0A1J9RNI9_9PEZI|nr:peptidase m35 [Diplodia corticola]OJD34107.1 peptidase m35 [Diplodia corticola]
MSLLKSVMLGALALSQFTQAYPAPDQGLEARKLYQVEDAISGLERRKLFNVDDISNDDHKKALKTGLKDAVEVASTALDKMDDEKYKSYLSAWFGDDDNHRDTVRQVYKNFVGSNHNKEGADVLGNVIVHNDDYHEINGQKFCSINNNGKTGTAYYKVKDKKPGMHFCPKFFERKSKDEYIKDKCAGIAQHINTGSIGRVFQGANVLHEFMHYSKVGKEATGTQVADPAYGAYNCYKLKDTDKTQTILNADSYVYYAMHIWLTETCGRDFSYPRDEQDN